MKNNRKEKKNRNKKPECFGYMNKMVDNILYCILKCPYDEECWKQTCLNLGKPRLPH